MALTLVNKELSNKLLEKESLLSIERDIRTYLSELRPEIIKKNLDNLTQKVPFTLWNNKKEDDSEEDDVRNRLEKK